MTALIGVTLGLLYVPWLEGIRTFGPVLYWMTGPRSNNFWPENIITTIATWLSIRNQADWNTSYKEVLDAFKLVAKMGLVVLLIVESVRVRSIRDVLAGSARVFIFFLLFVNTWVMPWYFTWPLAFSAALGWGERLVRVSAGLGLTAAIVMYQRQWSQPLVDEHGGILLVLPILLAVAPDVIHWAWSLIRRALDAMHPPRKLPAVSAR